MVAFLESVSSQSVVEQLNTLHAANIRRNRSVLKFIISAIELCGCQGIALRGHQDDAKHLEDTYINPGNYQALLKFRCDAGDTVVALSKCARNVTYRSKATQDDIIDILGGMITEKVIARVNETKFFVVISDYIQDPLQLSRLLLY